MMASFYPNPKPHNRHLAGEEQGLRPFADGLRAGHWLPSGALLYFVGYFF